jgi:hypothetical protein
MENIATKLAELSQRSLALEAEIEERRQHSGRPLADQTLAVMQKRLSSLRRSCQILARHLSACSGNNALPPPVVTLGHAELGVHLPGTLDLGSSGSTS